MTGKKMNSAKHSKTLQLIENSQRSLQIWLSSGPTGLDVIWTPAWSFYYLIWSATNSKCTYFYDSYFWDFLDSKSCFLKKSRWVDTPRYPVCLLTPSTVIYGQGFFLGWYLKILCWWIRIQILATNLKFLGTNLIFLNTNLEFLKSRFEISLFWSNFH
mgnify:CR=1 FL=1